uniref:Uncharacterized protein n=1 Tax=Rhizophora mucronata TaxID=61149 RepID=A0A2P2INI7_RHIMU
MTDGPPEHRNPRSGPINT